MDHRVRSAPLLLIHSRRQCEEERGRERKRGEERGRERREREEM
jgi:hypothetical protein